MQKKDLQKIVEDFGVALEQGHAAVYRRDFGSDVYAYMGAYIEKITGYSKEELTPVLWDSLILRTEQKGELAGLSLEEANQKVRSGKVNRWQADVQIRTRSGEKRWVTDMSTVLQDDAGSCLGVLLDITDRKEAEKKLAHLTETLRLRNQGIEADLAMAREVQQALITKQPTHFPVNVPVEKAQLYLHHRYIPAEMLAGDFFEILPLSNREVGVFICDVMGHGVRAALLTTFLRGLIEELIPVARDPGLFLGKINHSLRSVFYQDENLLFATAFYLVLDVTTGCIRYANAGHSKPLLLQPEQKCVRRLEWGTGGADPALGIIEDFVYSSTEQQLAPRESLLLYTDGLFEVYNKDEEMYGEERVVQQLQQNLQRPADQMIDNLLAELHRFSDSLHFEDDVCLISVVPV
jgi:sigma-B regulation protein RsbU (phosphoserine phosphatase)